MAGCRKGKCGRTDFYEKCLFSGCLEYYSAYLNILEVYCITNIFNSIYILYNYYLIPTKLKPLKLLNNNERYIVAGLLPATVPKLGCR